jgi:prepilin-type N-terminal cleavage/methylation domain-containing protein
MKKAFTLIEMIISVTILGLVLSVIIGIYFQMQKLRTDIFAKSILIKNTNLLVEKLNLVMKNYTIDYEEYFNRRIVGCV